MNFVLYLALVATPAPTVDLRPVDGHLLELARPMELVLQVRHEGPGVAVWPEPVPLPEDVELQSRRIERERKGGAVVDRLVLRVRPFVSGPLALPAFVVRLDGEALEVGPVRFHVRSPLPEDLAQTLTATALSPELRPRLEALMAPDAAPPLASEWNRPLLLALAFGALALGAGLAIWLWRRQPDPREPTPAPDPKATALAELAALGQAMEARPDALRAHHETLTSILRRAVGLPRARSAEALDKEEMAAAFAPSEGRDRLIDILQRADLVKFARWPATPQEARALLDEASAWVEQDLARLEAPPRGAGSGRAAPAAWGGDAATPPPSPGFEGEG